MANRKSNHSQDMFWKIAPWILIAAMFVFYLTSQPASRVGQSVGGNVGAAQASGSATFGGGDGAGVGRALGVNREKLGGTTNNRTGSK